MSMDALATKIGTQMKMNKAMAEGAAGSASAMKQQLVDFESAFKTISDLGTSTLFDSKIDRKAAGKCSTGALYQGGDLNNIKNMCRNNNYGGCSDLDKDYVCVKQVKQNDQMTVYDMANPYLGEVCKRSKESRPTHVDGHKLQCGMP